MRRIFKIRRAVFFFLVLFLIPELESLAQTNREHRGLTTILDTSFNCAKRSNNNVFEADKSIKEIVVSYYDYTPFVVYVYFDDFGTKNPKREYYDLLFPGDSCYLVHKYGHLNLDLPNFKMDQTQEQKDSGNLEDRIRSRIKKDSVHYRFSRKRLPANTSKRIPYSGIGDAAKPKIFKKFFEEGIADKVANTTMMSSVDSTVVFRAEITEKGQLQNLGLIVGRKSPFSEAVEAELQKRANSWNPASIRHAVQSYIRIFAKLNKDGTVRLETPRTLGTFTGE